MKVKLILLIYESCATPLFSEQITSFFFLKIFYLRFFCLHDFSCDFTIFVWKNSGTILRSDLTIRVSEALFMSSQNHDFDNHGFKSIYNLLDILVLTWILSCNIIKPKNPKRPIKNKLQWSQIIAIRVQHLNNDIKFVIIGEVVLFGLVYFLIKVSCRVMLTMYSIYTNS